jgi:hypothetical protein
VYGVHVSLERVISNRFASPSCTCLAKAADDGRIIYIYIYITPLHNSAHAPRTRTRNCTRAHVHAHTHTTRTCAHAHAHAHAHSHPQDTATRVTSKAFPCQATGERKSSVCTGKCQPRRSTILYLRRIVRHLKILASRYKQSHPFYSSPRSTQDPRTTFRSLLHKWTCL